MSYTDQNTPVIQKISLPSGNQYYIADRELRNVVDALSDTVAGGVSYMIAWDGSDTPAIGSIPAGVTVIYNDTEYTGTLAANSATPGAFYLVKSGTGAPDIYSEYVPVGATGSKTWQKLGDIQIDLTDIVTGVTLDKSTDTVIGSDATFTITQPTIALATDSTAGEGKVSVATGITSVTNPTISLSAESQTATGRVEYVKDLISKHLSASASGSAVAWNSKDQVTALTGVKVTTQPTVTLTANGSNDTGRITYVESKSSDTSKALVTTSITGVSGSTTPDVVKSRTSQTTADGTGTASSTNTDWLKGVSVSNGVLSIGAATLDTQTTYSADAPSSITIPSAASSATTVATGKVANSDTNGDSVITAVGAATTKYLSASASGTAVGADGTDTVIGSDSTFTVTNPSITLSDSGNSGIDFIASGTTKYMEATATGTAVTPATTNIKATASGANTAWNSKDQVTVLTNSTSLSVTKGN